MTIQVRVPDLTISQETKDGARLLLDNVRLNRDLSPEYIETLVAISNDDCDHLAVNYIKPESVVTGLRRAYKI